MMGTANFDLSKIIFYHAKYTDVWIRDYGPIFVKEGSEKTWVKWKYDGYGGKFPELSGDNDVFTELKYSINFKMHNADFVLEGQRHFSQVNRRRRLATNSERHL